MHWCLFIQYDNRKFFQTMYGHLATDDSAGELRQVRLILEEMIKMINWWYQVYQDITNNKTLRIANWWYQVYIYTRITIKLTFPSSSARVNFPVQFGLDFTSRDPRHSSRGRKEMIIPLPTPSPSKWRECKFQFVILRNDFDWSEESLSPGAGWGEYVEEFEVAI